MTPCPLCHDHGEVVITHNPTVWMDCPHVLEGPDMTDFTASNGVSVRANECGDIYLRGAGAPADDWEFDCNVAGALALREFFQHERDEALGRWRWPENPSFVAWASRRSNEKDVTVLDESSGYVGYFTRGDVADVRPGVGLIRGAARAYFEAHPERKPWEDAKAGDVWVIEVEGAESYAVHVVADFFEAVSFQTPTGRKVNMTNSTFTGFRKIWPEDAS